MIDSKLYTDPLIQQLRQAVEKAVADHNRKVVQNVSTFLRTAQTRNNQLKAIMDLNLAGVEPAIAKLWLEELNKYVNWWAREKGFAPKEADGGKPGSKDPKAA